MDLYTLPMLHMQVLHFTVPAALNPGDKKKIWWREVQLRTGYFKMRNNVFMVHKCRWCRHSSFLCTSPHCDLYLVSGGIYPDLIWRLCHISYMYPSVRRVFRIEFFVHSTSLPKMPQLQCIHVVYLCGKSHPEGWREGIIIYECTSHPSIIYISPDIVGSTVRGVLYKNRYIS
jgi:hypothetical protein